MSAHLHVLMGTEHAGMLVREEQRVSFTYDEAYRHKRDAVPLSLGDARLVNASYRHEVVDPWLWGLLPDNGDVLKRWERRFHASARSAFALLGTPVGQDCAGAVRFVSGGPSRSCSCDRRLVEWLSDAR